MYFPIRRSLPARPEADNTFWDDSTLEFRVPVPHGRSKSFQIVQPFVKDLVLSKMSY